MDFFNVQTLTGRLLVFVVLSHHRRRILHVNCNARPTSAWTVQQLVEAFPDDTAPRWLWRDGDDIYGEHVRRRIASPGISEVVSSLRSPWQNPYVERVSAYLAYYHRSRTHLALAKDTPDGRACSADGHLVVTAEVGGLHHRYDRQAA